LRAVYDYIVVGGGSSGSVVAGELAEDPSVRVLVLECGDRTERNPETLRASGYKDAFVNNRVMWERFSEPQRGAAGHQLFMGSGRGLGGSGSVNAMVYTRGSIADYEVWPSGWRWPDVLPAFERLEAKLGIQRQPPTRFTETCIRAAEAAGFRRKADLNDGTLRGFLGYNAMNVDGADRRSSYVAFLRPLEGRPNLTVLTRARVRRIVFDGRRAIGVEYEDNGQLQTATALNEVILCAGALETPKLLMLSGVGEGAHLRAHGVAVVADLPAVGRNLHDHPNVSLFFHGRNEVDCHWAQLYGFDRANPESALSATAADTCYVFYSARTSFKEGVICLVPKMALPMALYRLRPDENGVGILPEAMRAVLRSAFRLPGLARFIERMYGIVVILGKPQSRGTVRLRSPDVREQAAIDPNYFGEEADLRTLVRGVERARQVADQAALVEWGNRELLPGRRVRTAEAIASWVRKNAMTTYHYAGTCQLGSSADAVVTPRLEVQGLKGLRIADASVIPSVPVSAMNAPSMMIGLRAAELVREDRAAKTRARPSTQASALLA
jgi:choline dehydrogenase-like flavoprotein